MKIIPAFISHIIIISQLDKRSLWTIEGEMCEVYKNKWYASAVERPGKSNVWEYLRPCGGIVTYCGSQAWRSDLVYLGGTFLLIYKFS